MQYDQVCYKFNVCFLYECGGGGERGSGKVMNGLCVLVRVWRLGSITEAVKYENVKRKT